MSDVSHQDDLTTRAVTSNTLDWLRQCESISIPVYQREYRWDLNACRRLLGDIRTVALQPSGKIHFIGSLLAIGDGHVTLVDGQQRVMTLFLLLTALRDATKGVDAVVASEISDILFSGGTTRLRPHNSQAEAFAAIADGVGTEQKQDPTSPLAENYLEFVRLVNDHWADVWNGLHRLTHVTIRLGADAEAQQVFESLNSTGAPLHNYELIHNYVLMGLTRDQQEKIEKDYWGVIESLTAPNPERFWRDFFICTAPQLADLRGDYGLYRAFRERYRTLGYVQVEATAPEWVEYARSYQVLVHPENENDTDVSRHLRYLSGYFAASSPLVLGIYHRYRTGTIGREVLIDVFERLQTLLLRRELVGLDRDVDFVAPLCRQQASLDELQKTLIVRTPEDLAIRTALRYRKLPLAGYVLGRLQSAEGFPDLQLEHIHPQTPGDDWSASGDSRWGDLDESARAEYRIRLQTLGNLTLLEASLNQGAGNRSFPIKQREYYRKSKIDEVSGQLADSTTYPRWDTRTIDRRTDALTSEFLSIWKRPATAGSPTDPELVRVVDLRRYPRRDFFSDQFEYVQFEDEQWGDVRNVTDLWKHTARRLWQTHRDDLLAYGTSDSSWNIISTTRPPHTRWSALGDGYYVFHGWAWQWMLDELQKLLVRFDLSDSVRVRLAHPETEQNSLATAE